MVNQQQKLDALFNPSSLALIGASKDMTKSGWMFLKGLIDNGFEGQVYPINPKETEIMGLKAYPSVTDIPNDLDLAIMVVPARIVPQTMAECARKQVKFVVVHSAGFGEVGHEGERLWQQVAEIAREGNVRVVGPNCMGLFCPHARINTIVGSASLDNADGSTSFFGQSGWATENFLLMGQQRGLTFSKVVSSGNQTDLSTADYLEYFGTDPGTGMIGAYIEGIRDGRRFLEAAQLASREKPVVIWKAGKTEAGARAAASHTGSLASQDAIFDAASKQAGIIRATHLEELIDLAVGFTSPFLPSGDRVGILVEAGGGGVAAADACEELGLQVPALPEEVQTELRGFLEGVIPPSAGLSNPVDLVWPPYAEFARLLARCVEVMSRVVDVLMMVTYYPLADENFAANLQQQMNAVKKPVVVVAAHPTAQTDALSLYTRKGMPAYTSPRRASKAIAALVQYANYKRHL